MIFAKDGPSFLFEMRCSSITPPWLPCLPAHIPTTHQEESPRWTSAQHQDQHLIIVKEEKTTRSLFVTRLRIRMREGPDVWLNSRFQKKLLRHGHVCTPTAAPGHQDNLIFTASPHAANVAPVLLCSSVMYIRGWMIKQWTHPFGSLVTSI